MNRDLNNNLNNLSAIYNNQNRTNLTVSLLPTKLDVITSINNNNINYTTTTAINTLLTTTVNNQSTLRDQAIALALTAYTTSLLTVTLISNNILSNNLNYLTTNAINTLLTTTVNSQTTLRDQAITTALIPYTNTINLNVLLSNAVIARDTAISTANTTNTTYTNAKINTDIVDRNNAITAINTLMLSTRKVCTSTTSSNHSVISSY